MEKSSPDALVMPMAPFGEALIILWVAILTYGAHALLAVIQETAAGCDEITWPGNPWTDRLASFGYLLVLTGIWLGPVFVPWWSGILEVPTPYLVVIVFLFFWFIFPVTLLSALSSPSGLAALRPSLVWNLLKITPSLLVFYLASGMVLAGALWVFGLVIFMTTLEPIAVPGVTFLDWLLELSLTVGTFLLFPAAALVAAAGLLIYARLIGRLALRVRQLQEAANVSMAVRIADAPRQEAPRRLPDPDPATLELVPVSGPTSSEDVYAALPVDAPPVWAPAPAATASVETFPVLPADSDCRQNAAQAIGWIVPSRVESRLLRERKTRPEPPRWVFFSGVYSFPFRRANLRPLLVLTVGNLIVGVLLYFVARTIFG